MAAARTTRAFGSVPAFHSAYSARNRRSNRFTRLQIATENSPIRRLQPSAAIVFMNSDDPEDLVGQGEGGVGEHGSFHPTVNI